MGSILALPLPRDEHAWLARKSQDADERDVEQSQTVSAEPHLSQSSSVNTPNWEWDKQRSAALPSRVQPVYESMIIDLSWAGGSVTWCLIIN